MKKWKLVISDDDPVIPTPKKDLFSSKGDSSCFTRSIQEVVLKLESKSITLALFELPLL
jgi:hypothetical protein